MSTVYEECVRQYISRANKSEIKLIFERILNLVKEYEKITVSPQVKAIYLQMVISAANENDPHWEYNPNNPPDKIAAVRKMMIDVPEVLKEMRSIGGSDYMTLSRFLHYTALTSTSGALSGNPHAQKMTAPPPAFRPEM